jgi:D-alanyl-D-alanine carboxypeptidase/D-alanyl-D-alanine-endopeptidase (penicillin-binding protein 4)
LAFNSFKQLWKELGGHLHGSLVEGRVNKNQDKRLHLYQSPTLGEQIRTINKWSNNVMSRQLLLTLGAEKYAAPATLEKGRNAIIDVLKAIGVENTEDILIDNGSGLSRTAHFSAKQMASLLEAAYHDPYMPEFLASLSLTGMDGTLYKRFRKDDLKGRGHLKTGTINGVSTISGYMLNRRGKRFLIVIQQNGGRAAVALQNDILRWTFEQ